MKIKWPPLINKVFKKSLKITFLSQSNLIERSPRKKINHHKLVNNRGLIIDIDCGKKQVFLTKCFFQTIKLTLVKF